MDLLRHVGRDILVTEDDSSTTALRGTPNLTLVALVLGSGELAIARGCNSAMMVRMMVS